MLFENGWFDSDPGAAGTGMRRFLEKENSKNLVGGSNVWAGPAATRTFPFGRSAAGPDGHPSWSGNDSAGKDFFVLKQYRQLTPRLLNARTVPSGLSTPGPMDI